MSKIQQFEEFIKSSNLEIQKIKDKEKELAIELLKEFFSEEVNVINDILDMKSEWEDEGVNFYFDLNIHNKLDTHTNRRCADLGRYSKEINLIDIILKFFGSSQLTTLIPDWEKNGHRLILFVEVTISAKHQDGKKIVDDCISSLFERLKSAYPHFKYDNTFHQAIKISF